MRERIRQAIDALHRRRAERRQAHDTVERRLRVLVDGAMTAAPAPPFDPAELVDVPAPVQRYLARAIAPGTPVGSTVQLRMRGRIRLHGRWLPFLATQVLDPFRGTVWAARVAGVIVGSDSYATGEGGMDWRLAGIVPVAAASGPDVTRSAAERAGAESVWVPTALLPRFGVEWSAARHDRITARFSVDGHPVALTLALDRAGDVVAASLPRWGDPDETGMHDLHPFGAQVTGIATFAGIRIPAAGEAGWHIGTSRWSEGTFFRYEITGYDPVVPAS